MSELNAHLSLAHFLKVGAGQLPDLAYCWHTRNESANPGERVRIGTRDVPVDVLRGGQLGVISGVWDWLFLGMNKATIAGMRPEFFSGLAIELKSSKAYRTANHGLSPEQCRWQTRYIVNGWHTAIYPENDWVGAAHLLIRWVGGNVDDFRF